MNNNNFPILKNSTPSTSEKNINFINEMISNTLFNRKANGEINLHEFSSKAKTFRSYDKFLDTNELDAEKLKEIKAFMNSVDKLEPIRDGLICWLDGRDGNNNDRTTIWKDRSGNGNDATLLKYKFTVDSGWEDGVLRNSGDGEYASFTKPIIPTNTMNYTIIVNVKSSNENRPGSETIFSFGHDATKGISLERGTNIGSKFIFGGQPYMFNNTDYNSNGFVNINYRGVDSVCLTVNTGSNVSRTFVNSEYTGISNNLNGNLSYMEDQEHTLFTWPLNINGRNFKGETSRILVYNRELSDSEIRHNYLYDLSVQYLLKNQVNSNTIETYYDFDPNYDLPDNRIEGCLMVSNGRLVYYNPSGSAPLRIANNKTLDECIVEETEDYIIYSDGEVTADNPIPEGIYFACRVDKHTGEIYYGEGYENLRDMSSNYEHYNSLKILNEDWVKFTRNNPGGTYSFSSILYTENVVHNVSLVSKGEDGGCLRTLGGNTRTNFNIIKENHKPPLFELVCSAKRTNKQWVEPSINKVVPTGYKLFVNKFQITRTENKKPYIRNKQPKGLLAFISNKTTLDTSFLFKDRKSSRPGSTSSSVLTSTSDGANSDKFSFYMNPPICDTEQTIDIFVSGSYKVSEMTVTNTSNSGGFLNLAYKVHSNPAVGWTESIKAFIFYKGDLTQAELEAEKNKTFKLKKFYRTNSNQSSFLGLEDIFTNNNTKEIIDGTIIDTTKTPIEYKEQKDISKTTDIASYTKNNINIEKSKCGFIRDIRNTNDFKNLPNNLVAEPSKYDEKYQSPTINIIRVIDDKYGFGYGYNNTDGANVTIDNQILKTVIKNKNKSINSYPLTSIRQNSTSYIGKTLSVSFLIKGVGTTRVDIHQIRSNTGQNSVGRGRTIELTDEYTRYTISNFICNESHQNMAITVDNTVDIIEIKDIQVELSPVATDYTPPNSDGNFIPTIGESGIFSIKQTTKDTDKNSNTFARTIFLP